MSEEQQKILLEFCSKPENTKVVEFIRKGTYNTSTEEFTLTNDDGVKVVFKIDELSNNTVDFSPLFQSKVTEVNEIEQLESNSVDNEIEEILDENISLNITTPTLYDLNSAVNEKNIKKVDELLSTFAINPNTGLVDIDKAIGTVTTNTLNEAVKCVQNNTDFSSDLSKYDLKGNYIGNQNTSDEIVDISTICDKSFENILVFTEVAKIKGTIYDEEKKLKAKKIYATMLNDKINVLGLNGNDTEIKEENNVVESKNRELALKPNTDLRKAGFADIFILTIIVIVYAIIIVNLIVKLK